MAISTSPRRKASNTASPTTTPEAFSSTAPASPLPNLLAGLRWGTQEVLAPAAVLTAIGAWQRNRMLALLGVATGVVGGLEGLFVVVHQGLPPAWAWLQSVVYALAGLALLTVGLVTRRRERSAP